MLGRAIGIRARSGFRYLLELLGSEEVFILAEGIALRPPV